MKSSSRFVSIITAVAVTVPTSPTLAAIPPVVASFFMSGGDAVRMAADAYLDTYCDAAVGDRSDYANNLSDPPTATITTCTTVNTSALPTSIRGIRIAVYTRSGNDLIYGARPVAVPQPIRFLDGSTCPTTDGNASTTQLCTALTSDADLVAPDGSGDGRVPDFTLTAHEPLFTCRLASATGSFGLCTGAEIAGLESSKVNASAIFQVPMTILVGSQLAAELGTTGLSPAVLRAVFSGAYSSVGQVKKAMSVTPLAGDDTEGLKICRTLNSRGVQHGHTQLWLGSSHCGAQTLAAAFVDESYDDSNAANGYPADYEVDETSVAPQCVALAGSRSIGISSTLEPNPFLTAVKVNIDGVAPTVVNAALGRYPWIAEASLNSNADVINSAVGLPTIVKADLDSRALPGQRTAFRNGLRSLIRLPSAISSAGITANALPNWGVPSYPYNSGNPTSWVDKNGNNCKNPALLFP